ncbi:MAG: hypothetical protein BroJett030_18910 [Alphaproteobacteria bacterium]|nr:MAG: hypothetical protein BroJett030_18910 [Alphaproteobacteria bacterium]
MLLFGLGFLSAALIALMISPAVWNRAVVLTKRRIEASVPLTLNEIQADKDQLRAEFAMSTRRLEMSVEELRERAARQVIEISRKRDELARLVEESRERVRYVEELESRSAELRAQLRDREERLAAADRRLQDARAELEDKAREIERMRGRLSESETDIASRRIELVAKQTAMENLSDQFSEVSEREAAMQRDLDAEKKKHRDLEKRLARLQKQLTEAEGNLEVRESELSRLRESAGSEDQINSDLTHQLMMEKSRVVELEAKLAQTTLQMEALLNDASNDNVEKAMTSLNRDKQKLEERLTAITAERDRLRQDLGALERVKSQDWESERRENAILRERINDLAAQVTAMTAAIEGNHSAINDILAAAPRPVAPPQRPSAAGKPAGFTLADRIRALQESARQNKAG